MTRKIVQLWKRQTLRGKHFLAALVPVGIIFAAASGLYLLEVIDKGHFFCGVIAAMLWGTIFSFIPYKHSSLLD